MRLKRLTIKQMPGIDYPFTVSDFSEGLNLIVGQNESGKTTFCRAVRALLWSDREKHEPFSVDGEWEDGDATLWCGREGATRTRWEKDGVEVDPPNLPESRAAHCFTLGFRDLLLPDNSTDQEIAHEIRLLMSGGVDVQAVQTELFSIGGQLGRKEEKSLGEKRKLFGGIQGEQRALADEEAQLGKLESDLKACLQAQSDVEVLKTAQELAVAREKLQKIKEELNNFPDFMEKVLGNELTQIEDLEKEISDLEGRVRENEDEIDKAEKIIQEAKIPGDLIDDTVLREMQDRVRNLEESYRQIERAKEGIKTSGEKLKTATERLDQDADVERLIRIDREARGKIESFFKRAVELQKESFALEKELGVVGKGESTTHHARDLEQGIDLLRGWLSVSMPMSGTPLYNFLVHSIIVGGGLLLATIEPLSGAFFVGIGLSLLGVSVFARSRANSEKQNFQRGFQELKLTESMEWNQETVRSKLRDISDLWQQTSLQEKRKERMEALEFQQIELAKKAQSLENEREDIKKDVGVDPGSSELDLFILAVNILAYFESYDEANEAEVLINQLRHTYVEQLSVINEFLVEYDEATASDSFQASSVLDSLRDRNEQVKQARDIVRRETQSFESQSKTIVRQRKKQSEVYSTLGLVGGDKDGLQEMVRRFDHFRNASNDEDRLKRNMEGLKASLGDRGDLMRLSIEDAENKLREAREKAEEIRDVSGKVQSIKDRVEKERKGNRLERALSDVSKALETLGEKRDETLYKAAGNFLLDNVTSQYDEEIRPPVLQGAMDLFGKFTHYRYEFRLHKEDEKPVFRALETTTGRGKALSELSDGTRIQLLLSARLAYAEHTERGVKVPLFLDEVLTTSDPQRFHAIADSLLHLADEGRQVFYLSANPSDTIQWRMVSKEKGLESIDPIDLGEIRNLGASVSAPELLEIEETPQIPSPGRLSPEEYGSLIRVTPIDPYRPVASLHLFHLLRHDLITLHTLMSNGIETLGQWLSLVGAKNEEAFVENENARRITALVATAVSFFDVWSIGRGKRIDSRVLKAAGVSSTYLDRLPPLLERLNGDPVRFLTALDEKKEEEAQGFRAKAFEELEEYLIDQGYVDNRPTMNKGSIKAHVISSNKEYIEKNIIKKGDISRLLDEFFSLLKPDRQDPLVSDVVVKILE